MCVSLFCFSLCVNLSDTPLAFSISDSTGEESKSFCSATRWVHTDQQPCDGCQGWRGTPLAMRDQRTPLQVILLSLLYVGKALFHPVIYCVVLSLAILIPRYCAASRYLVRSLGGWRCDGFCYSPYSWNPPPGLVMGSLCSA